jgi:hypothetical protein
MRNLARIVSAALLSSALAAPVALAQAECEGGKCPLPENLTEGMGGTPEGGAQVEGGAQMEKRQGAAEEETGQAAGETDETQTGATAEPQAEITAEQQAEVKSTIEDLDVEKVEINFNLNIGIAVPASVSLRPVPVRIVRLVPAYEGFLFFVTADGTIVIVAPDTRKVVYIIV